MCVCVINHLYPATYRPEWITEEAIFTNFPQILSQPESSVTYSDPQTTMLSWWGIPFSFPPFHRKKGQKKEQMEGTIWPYGPPSNKFRPHGPPSPRPHHDPVGSLCSRINKMVARTHTHTHAHTHTAYSEICSKQNNPLVTTC